MNDARPAMRARPCTRQQRAPGLFAPAPAALQLERTARGAVAFDAFLNLFAMNGV
jgi:hypothetical protein